MKRCGFKRKEIAPRSRPRLIPAPAGLAARVNMRGREVANDADYAPAYEAPESRKREATDAAYLAACRGEQCYLRVPGICQARGWGSETVVPAHSNQLKHGKGRGIKAQDVFTVPGCYACHYWLDQGRDGTKEQRRDVWDRAYRLWEPVRREKLGIMEVPDGVTI